MSLIRRTQIENIIGEISTNNSTTTPLASGASFIGEQDEISNFKAIGISIFVDQDSAVDGLRLEWSTDGTNWDYVLTFNVSSENGGLYFQVGIVSRYFRIVYTNGDTPQSVFRLQTILHPTATVPESQRISDLINNESLVFLNKSVIAGDTIDGDFRDITSTRQGRLKISEKEVDEGNEWASMNSVYLSGGQVVKILIVPPPSGSASKLRFTYRASGPKSYSASLWEDTITTFDGYAGILLVVNRFREYSGTPPKTFETYSLPTVAASGTQLGYWYIDGGGALEANIGGRPGDLIFKNGSKYLIRLKNESNDPQYLNILGDFTL